MKREVDVVGAVIWNEAGEVLCALRSAAMSSPGLWEFPGGKIEAGEEPKATLRREIREELGCEIVVYAQLEDTLHEGERLRVRLRTFHATIARGEPVPREHEILAWRSPASLGELVWSPADIPTVEKLLQGAVFPVDSHEPRS